MKKFFIPLSLFLCALVLTIACNFSGKDSEIINDPDRVLHVYNWENYIHPEVVTNFERDFKVKIDNMRLVFAVVLLHLGLDPDSTNPQDIARTKQYLIDRKDYFAFIYDKDIGASIRLYEIAWQEFKTAWKKSNK
jgi:spermidine/putrescine-binding protein